LAYGFLSIVLIGTTAIIVWYAWRWTNAEDPSQAEIQPTSAGTLVAQPTP
jgi:hypothetical protein